MRFVFALALAALAAALLASKADRSTSPQMVTADPPMRAALSPGDLDHAEGW